MDCWGIVKLFYRLEFGVELKSYYDNAPYDTLKSNSLIRSAKGDFRRISRKEIKFGDILLVTLKGIECHIAVYLGEGKILHSTENKNCVIEPIRRWERSISQCYRVLEND